MAQVDYKATYPDDLGWQGYEELVKDIYQALGGARGVTIECWGAACKVKGQTGMSHQIDVLARHDDGLNEYRTAISCKYWKQKVGIREVRDLADILDDTRLNKGVIFSKMGFTGPAKVYAKAKGIGLIELRKPLDRDWEGHLRNVHIKLIMEQPEYYDVSLNLSASTQETKEGVIKGGPVHWPLKFNQIVITVPEQAPQTLHELAKGKGREGGETGEYSFKFPEDSVVTIPDYPDHPAHGYSITGASFKVRFNPPIERDIVITGDDYVFMIMQSLFEGRRFTITKDRKIRESDTKGLEEVGF